ncbi:ATP-dependent bile acid permease [Histoplasma capsulatum H143]|uniref:ATP-dependent bile acid permease n=1 Tax=Ajellomyces capsulatus (strain H143) TaxID=544712 RepID=C6HER9_AJECH|nr:ATP-dependent bile acid permease [Histoplasma capsulatum H143]
MRQGCEGPVWVVDDLTLCFQQRHNVRLPWARHGYKPIPTTIVEYNDIEDENDGEDVEDAESDLMLHKALSLTTPITIEQNRPRWKNVVTILEIVALVGELGVSVKSLATPSGALNETSPTIGRLVLSTSERCTIPKLWNHTASLYSFQWLCTVMVFRSVLIHPTPNHTLTIIDFLLSSFLFLLTITTRKGNQTLLVRYEDGIPPPREQFASLLALASFAWLDPLVWQGFRKSLEMPDVWNLLPSYQAAAVLADFRQARRTSSLAWSLLRYFDRTLLIQGAWTIFSSFFSFMPTWLLKLILEYLQDPENTPKNAAWLYVSLLFVCATVQGVADGQALWRGRKLSVKLRAIIIGELYAKALRRKAGAITKTSKDEEKSQKLTKKKKIFSLGWNNKPADANTESSEQPKPDEPDAQANIGKIINLMAIDSFKVSEICAYLHYLWASFPVQTAIAIYILYKILGFSSLAGIGVMTLMLPLNLYIASRFRVLQHEILAGTDARIHSTNEVLQNIRIIKYFAWEQRFEDIVNEKRKAELKNLRRRYMLWACAATVWYGTPILITLISFFLYTIVEGKKLVPSVAFPALSTFSLLRIPLDQLADMIAHVQESKASIDRVENFLNEEETEKYTQLRSDKHSESAPRIALENATLSWGPSLPSSTTGPLCSQGNDSGESFCLINMDVSFRIGQLNVIAGPTGSGKTSLLMALLGEMTLLKGSVFLPGGTSDRADLRVDPATGLTDSVAYCAQEAWEAIMGPLMQNRTCILVSHNISLVVPNAAFLVVLDNGRITAQGTTQEVVASGILGDEILQSRPASVSSKSRTHSLSSIETVKTGWENGTTSASGTTNGAANGADVMYNKKKGPAVAVPLREEKIVGSVKFSTIIMYLRAMGPWYFWFFALLAFGAQQVGSLATNIWIREWANAYPMRKVSINDVGNKAALSNFRLPTLVTADISRPFSWRAPEMQFTDNDSPFRDDVNPYYYLGYL